MAKPRFSRKAPFAVRSLIACGVLGLFFYAYLAPSNSLLALLVKLQFSAALYGLGIWGLAVMALTLAGGRVYCSALCPLGTWQELFGRLGSLLRRGKGPALAVGGYVPPARLRFVIPLAVGAGLALPIFPLMLGLDPLSAFGRGLRGPFAGTAAPRALVMALPLALIGVIAFFRGRAFCDWCPVGFSLGLFSALAPLGMKVSAACVSCGICEQKCPARCMNSREKRLDAGRCVLCFSCAAACPSNSVNYGRRGLKTALSESRRLFLKRSGAAALAGGAVYLAASPVKRLFHAAFPLSGGPGVILPPGAGNSGHYTARCIGCQACTAVCPVGVIKPKHSPQPVLDFSEAACQFNCVECGKVCPTGAIRRLDVAEKQRTRIALSSLNFDYCVVKTKGESCGACAEVCPTHALSMEAYPDPGIPFLTRPVFDPRYCVGCGACLAACPAIPKALAISPVAEQTLTPGIRPVEDREDAGEDFLYQAGEEFPF